MVVSPAPYMPQRGLLLELFDSQNSEDFIEFPVFLRLEFTNIDVFVLDPHRRNYEEMGNYCLFAHSRENLPLGFPFLDYDSELI